MADLLIKGMEMPDKLHTIDTCRDADGVLQANCGDGTGWHDVVEIPTHGRLIDEDLLIADIRKNSASYFADDFAREWTSKQPTVIEASEVEK